MKLNTLSTNYPSPLKSGRASLRIGGISAVLGSLCCVSPYLLVTLGISSSAGLYLVTLIEWSRPVFILLALIALCFAYQQIWRPELAYNLGQYCVKPQKTINVYKVYFLFIVILVVAGLMLPHLLQIQNAK